MRAVRPSHPTLLELITLVIFDEKENYEALHYTVLCVLLLLTLSYSALCSLAPSISLRVRKQHSYTTATSHS